MALEREVRGSERLIVQEYELELTEVCIADLAVHDLHSLRL